MRDCYEGGVDFSDRVPAGNDMFQRRRSGVFIVYLQHLSHLVKEGAI